MRQIGERAVVLGGSVAGMTAARVLSDHYTSVVVVERDDLAAAGDGLRPAVPWAIHIHALLERGRRILEDLYPGFLDQLVERGVPVGDYGSTCHYYFDGRRFADTETGMACVGANRPVIEHLIRTRTLERGNVELRDTTDIVALAASPDRSRITGVHVTSRVDGRSELIEGDLVVDATGRGSRTPRWLEEFGYERPPEEVVRMNLTYTTMDFVGPLSPDPLGEDIALVPTATPALPRGGIFARLADRYALTLTGIDGDRAPTDRAGFLDYASTLPVPEIHEAVRGATPRGPAGSFRFPASVRKRFERLRRFPDGYLVLGDAACIFNPVYAQGMTVAAMGAELLRDHLERRGRPDAHAYFAALAAAIDSAWMMSAAADLGYPGVEGRRTVVTRIGNAYMSRVMAAAAYDPVVARAFMRTISLVDEPTSLATPAMMFRVLVARRRRPAAEVLGDRPSTDRDAATAA